MSSAARLSIYGRARASDHGAARITVGRARAGRLARWLDAVVESGRSRVGGQNSRSHHWRCSISSLVAKVTCVQIAGGLACVSWSCCRGERLVLAWMSTNARNRPSAVPRSPLHSNGRVRCVPVHIRFCIRFLPRLFLSRPCVPSHNAPRLQHVAPTPHDERACPEWQALCPQLAE
jgi:hypothetical protein